MPASFIGPEAIHKLKIKTAKDGKYQVSLQATRSRSGQKTAPQRQVSLESPRGFLTSLPVVLRPI